MHHHDHPHDHAHHHDLDPKDVNTAFLIGIALNIGFVAVEVVIGLRESSLALLSDAGHNASDVLSLVLSLFAFRLMKKAPTLSYTYGYRKAGILASLANALLLVAVVGVILYEAVERILHPQPVSGQALSWVAAVGVGVNGISAWLFVQGKDRDINIKGAYLHLLSDALVSLGVVVTGIVVSYTGWYLLDPVISVVIAVIIFTGTWSLLKTSLRMALDGLPDNVDPDKVRAVLGSFAEVKEVHHLHIWAMSSRENALTAHLRLHGSDLAAFERIKPQLRGALRQAGIHHATLEAESGGSEGVCPL